jgi:hypothetical protein
VLRIETVISDPQEIRVRWLRTRQGRREMVWCPMNKGAINLYLYREVSLAASRLYPDALAVVEAPAPTYRQVEKLTGPMVVCGCSQARYNPASPMEIGQFRAALDGDHLLRGFRNAEFREALYGSIEDAGERWRQGHAGGRTLKRMHGRGLIVKVS